MKNWEKQFDKKFEDFPGGLYIGEKHGRAEDIKDFIRKVLQKTQDNAYQYGFTEGIRLQKAGLIHEHTDYCHCVDVDGKRIYE